MLIDKYPRRLKATQMLVVATLFWGLSFPVMKALGMSQQQLLPQASSWFISSSAITMRFTLAALIMLVWCRRSLRQITHMEIWQGVGLGILNGAGILMQMDGLAYTSASTSAFLTQCSCLFIPVFVAFRDRQWPSMLIVVCCFLVVMGVAILANLDWQTVRLGRGEVETLIGAVLFAGQILWLERPLFRGNRVDHFSLVMFAVIALVCLPVSLLTTNRVADWAVVYSSPAALALTALLVLFCTMIAYVLMNYWQPHVSASEAGLIYGTEPVFASLFALFLPAWLSALAELNYPNEQLTWNLVVGGGLITLANLLIQSKAALAGKSNSASVGLALE
ncbi:MAG: DMT family transporter [Verrucomicrobia bacterium]|nr:DMT family transporter [Verrucomicrobiota bacterium]